MTISHLEYDLHDGYIHNWLVAGPQAIAIESPERFEADERKLQIARRYHEADSGILERPVDRGTFTIDGAGLRWNYVRCLDDHLVDLSTFYHTWHYLRSWAYAEVTVPATRPVTLVLTTNGPADLWLNGEHLRRQGHFRHQDPGSNSLSATLEQGRNEFLVRFEEVAARECPYVMALRIDDLPERGTVLIPTAIERVLRRRMFERAFEQAYLDEYVNHRGDVIDLHWVDDLDTRCNFHHSVQDEQGRIYVSGTAEAAPSKVIDVGHGYRIWEGPYRVVLRPRPEEYYDHDIRYQRDLPIQVVDNEYSDAFYGTYAERRQEALEDAAGRKGDLYAEIARMALGRWDEIDADSIEETIARINRREDCSDFYMVGLLGIAYRYADDPAFPERLRQPIERCILDFKYWLDEPGDDAMCYTTENHSILFHTCEILAGQLYPAETFTNVDRTGQWHREKGERLASSWLEQRGRCGFLEWDSNCYFEEDLLALSHLVDLAEDTEVLELAAVVMDKMLFTMAVNSHRGAFGSTHGRTYTPYVRSARLEPTSGISRLMWGMGVFNRHIRGTVALACSDYELPPLIAGIANDSPAEMWNRERHVGPEEAWEASGSLGPEVNKVTYKTPDYMLSSAQDYHPGEKGYQQHIWQATLGPDAVVFVNHPPCMSEGGAHRPNFWRGNYVLPRVAQWKDVLIAIHDLPEDDWMGFTHAYFPAPTFDDYALRDGWAFARKGEGYLALTATHTLELIERGPSAYRELRSYGSDNIWLCQMGRATTDGEFDEFQEKVLALDTDFHKFGVRTETLRRGTLSFGWNTPLRIDGEEQPIIGFKHYENPYCVADVPAAEMRIRFRDYLLALDFTDETATQS